MKDCDRLEAGFLGEKEDFFAQGLELDLGTGRAALTLGVNEGVFYRVLGEECGLQIGDDLSLMRLMRTLSEDGKEYAKVKEAFRAAKESGYGVVSPRFEELSLAEPKLVKRGANYGVRFKAGGASYHIVKVEIDGEVEPIVGGKAQGETFLEETMSAYNEDTAKVWDTNIFGRTLQEMLDAEIMRKSGGMPPLIRGKVAKTLGRIVNEGKGGFFCILL